MAMKPAWSTKTRVMMVMNPACVVMKPTWAMKTRIIEGRRKDDASGDDNDYEADMGDDEADDDGHAPSGKSHQRDKCSNDTLWP